MTSITNIQNLQFPPLRTLDDFLLGSARFQLPNYRDLDKWGNRVVKNLLYYQTNYILMFLVIYLLMLILYPGKIFVGIIIKALLLAAFINFFPDRVEVGNRYQKWYYLGGTVVGGYILLIWFDALLLSAFSLLLPFCAMFVHSSLRLRNIRNKVANAVESLGPSTPMSVFLNSMNITVENILS